MKKKEEKGITLVALVITIAASNIIGNYGLRPMVIIPTSNFQFNIID